jgi:hypothetical protein
MEHDPEFHDVINDSGLCAAVLKMVWAGRYSGISLVYAGIDHSRRGKHPLRLFDARAAIAMPDAHLQATAVP